MRSIEFYDLSAAANHRKQHGGWLFVIGATNAWWFDAKCYTPYSIFTSRQLRGFSGELVCDNRFCD